MNCNPYKLALGCIIAFWLVFIIGTLLGMK